MPSDYIERDRESERECGKGRERMGKYDRHFSEAIKGTEEGKTNWNRRWTIRYQSMSREWEKGRGMESVDSPRREGGD